MSPRPPSINAAQPVRVGPIGTVLVAGAIAAVAPGTAGAQESDPWPMAGRDAAHTGTAEGPAPPYREAWSSEVGLGGPVAGPVVAKDVVVVVAERGVVGLDPATGAPLWEAARSEGPAGGPAIAGDLVMHVTGSGSGTSVVARSLADGREAWRSFVDAGVLGSLVAADGLVYAGTASGEVVVFQAKTGEEEWRADVGGRIDATPAVAEGLVLVASAERSTGVVTLVALDAATGGDPQWRFSTPGAAVPASAPGSSDGRALVATSDGALRALGLDAGGEAWTARLRAAVSARQIPSAGEPLVMADRLHLSAFDEAGEERWRFLLADLAALPGGRRNTLSASSPAVVGGAAVIGDTSGVLSAVDVASGRRVWQLDLGTGPVGPVAAGSDLLYAATLGEGGSVTALEHDPGGALLDEASPTTVFPLQAVLNFLLAAAGVSIVAYGLSRLALRGAP